MAFHATDLSVAVPVTEAVNCRVPPVVDEAELGVMLTAVTVDVGEPGGFVVEAAVTTTLAEPDLVTSALLVAVTVSTTAFVGAV